MIISNINLTEGLVKDQFGAVFDFGYNDLSITSLCKIK